MLTRTLLRQSRLLTSLPPATSASASASISTSTSTSTSLARQPLASTISSRLPAPARARIQTRRWHALSATQALRAEQPASDESLGDSAPAPENSAAAEAASKADHDQDPTTKSELEKKDREIIELKDRYLRSVADFRNLQDRSRREVSAARDFGIQKFARDLIESVDNLDLALSNVPAESLVPPPTPSTAVVEDTNKELRQLHGGLKMTNEILMSTLKKHGLERFDPSEDGERFDPNVHEATFQTKVEGKEDGTCFLTTQKGFRLNGRVVRAAKVGVVKNS
ncbi:MAG: Mitochondrial matrix cochaperone [Chrysothrix sp. TS-e1954]|nr:MAG: Mitochondrial matrix cochaperone [Chrysothrix sp. TS-e1954]